MSWKEPLRGRERSLEEAFIQRQEEMLRKRTRDARARDEEISALREVSGIREAALLDDLLDHGLGGETFAGLELLPLVLAAWV